MEWQFILKFLVLTAVVSGTIIFFLHRTLISTTEGAVNRLNQEIEKANAKQAELSAKIKQADDELAKRQAEAKKLAEKMKSDAEEQSKAEREKIIGKAREEGEEIIAKAHSATEKIKQEIEKEMEVKIVNYSTDILNDILSEKAKGSLNEVLIDEFLNGLQNVDMSKISPDVKSAELVSLTDVDESIKNRFSQVIKDKLNRDISISAKTDPELGGGVMLKFGSMALDGSLRNLIREKGVAIKEKIEMD